RNKTQATDFSPGLDRRGCDGCCNATVRWGVGWVVGLQVSKSGKAVCGSAKMVPSGMAVLGPYFQALRHIFRDLLPAKLSRQSRYEPVSLRFGTGQGQAKEGGSNPVQPGSAHRYLLWNRGWHDSVPTYDI